ncbi:tail fiber assembly protein [Pantoea sp. BAV 3049]|uniref:tail fiber assembly protein n=1 Tax=Pantoea sp. BAV 3049 TaxID=2654188 RepID=UPI00131B923D|nr:tail fiber assembly protein [Pantoea sp. BAV 3049]
MRYSPSEKGFFAEEIEYNNLPDDLVTISEDVYSQLISGQADGKIISAGDDGKPFLSDPDYVSEAEQKKSSLTRGAMQSVDVIQLKLQAGRTLTDTEKATLNAVLDYIDSLEAVDTSNAPNIVWPDSPLKS